MTPIPECANCGGTGKVVLMRSWFPADGYRTSDCPICDGCGRSSFVPEAEVMDRQRELREWAARPSTGEGA